jgi:hypothetical protein
MEQSSRVKMRQVVDWSAALWAGLISGLLYLITAILLSGIILNNPLLPVQMIAAILLGSDVVLQNSTVVTILIALLIHIPMSLFFAAVVAFVIHRWGLLVGVFGGAALGLALYGINFFALSGLFPWFVGLRGGIMIFSHLVFGAAAGGFYELLEVEEFEAVN